MKKENFVSIINAILDQEKRERALEDAMRPFLGDFMSEASTGFIDHVVKILENEMNDPGIGDEVGPVISWWLYDAPKAGENKESAWVDVDGEKISLYDAGELFEYLMSCQKNK